MIDIPDPDDDRCGALWHDTIGNTPTARCTYEAGHTGPHHNPNGTTWGGPQDWGIHA